MSQPMVRDNPAATRYEIVVDDAVAGFAHYRVGAGHLVFDHTEVEAAYNGQGLGSLLARQTLDDVRARGLKVVAECPFIKAYIRRHDEYSDLLVSS